MLFGGKGHLEPGLCEETLELYFSETPASGLAISLPHTVRAM